MNNMHLLKANTAMVWKYYVFQLNFVAYNVSMNKNVCIISFFGYNKGWTFKNF